LDIISILTAFQLLLLTFFLISHQKGKKVSQKILAVFLFANALYILDFLQFHLKLYRGFPHFIGVGFSFIFLFGPLLYFYTNSLVAGNFSFKNSHLLHFLPFMLLWTYMSFHFYIHDAATKIELIAAHQVFSVNGQLSLFDVAHIMILGYMITTLNILRKFRTALKSHFSSIEHLNLSWLRLVLYGFLFMWLCDLANSFLPRLLTVPAFLPYSLTLLSLLINFVFANIAVYRSLKQPEIFTGKEEEKQPKPKYEKSLLTPGERELYLQKLLVCMKSRKPYLNPALTISELSEQVAVPPRYLSQVINESLNQNFFDFVNQYRIDEAKRLLKDPRDPGQTVLEVLYEVGFNSKSAFNTAFKRHTGTTPSEFKKHRFVLSGE
jgi:AraC-like DNA-binding protein